MQQVSVTRPVLTCACLAGLEAGEVGLVLTYAVTLIGNFQWTVRQSAEVENMVRTCQSLSTMFNDFVGLLMNKKKNNPTTLLQDNQKINELGIRSCVSLGVTECTTAATGVIIVSLHCWLSLDWSKSKTTRQSCHRLRPKPSKYASQTRQFKMWPGDQVKYYNVASSLLCHIL